MKGYLGNIELNHISFTIWLEHHRPERREKIWCWIDPAHGVQTLRQMRQMRHKDGRVGKAVFVDVLTAETPEAAQQALAAHFQTLLSEIEVYGNTLFAALQAAYSKKERPVTHVSPDAGKPGGSFSDV